MPSNEVANEFQLLKEVLRQRGDLPIKIISDSMTPLIQVGDQLTLAPITSVAALRRFDIVVFWNRDQLTCHYIWSKNHLRFSPQERLAVTRSLKGGSEDLPVDEKWILGVVKDRRVPRRWRLSITLRQMLPFWLR